MMFAAADGQQQKMMLDASRRRYIFAATEAWGDYLSGIGEGIVV